MRVASAVSLVLLFSVAAAAADLKIKVVDPQSAAVAGAQVSLVRATEKIPATQMTSAEGMAVLHVSGTGPYQVKILAPGFAVETVEVPSQAETFTVTLHLATAAETVVVSATRTPVADEAAGADVDSLSGAELTTMQPVAANDAVRFLPGAVVNTAGQHGGLSSLFVRGGNSNYNKVLVDGVSVTEAGGTIDFGTLSLAQADRLEFLRGAQSTLYGSDAMSSVVQVWTHTGSTRIPELQFGADAGNYGTESGYASLAGARGRFDYNVFGHQFNTSGSDPNDDYSNSLEGMNAGFAPSEQVSLRLRVRHDNSVTGAPGAWNFNGNNVFNEFGTTYVLSPDLGGRARQNNFLASLDLAVKTGPNWMQHFTGFEFNLKTTNLDTGVSPENTPYGTINTPFEALVNINRAGFDYQGDYLERSWAQTTVGYEFEDENGSVNDPIPALYASYGQGLRLNEAAYVQQALTLDRLNVIAGVRFVHNTTFGNVGVPRVALGFQALRGGHIFSGTRFNGSFATGIKEPRFEETFVSSQYQLPNPNLKAERNRALEAGFQQNLLSRFVLVANYFNNLFHDQIEFETINPTTFQGQYENLEKSLAHGAEVGLQSRITQRLSWNASYTYTSTQILQAPAGSFPPYAQGDPLLRRPRHSATTLLSYLASRWGGTLGGSFVGPRPDSDFDGFNINHTPGYFLLDLGGWYKVNSHITIYANAENVLDHFYEEVTGYPSLRANFRAGMRFRIGGE
ncbi:TonB-dependent receptor [Candidatus Sulfotelmatobacter kueseliae]|uniref:TonB-dependent receptor n=1 Tax=Candidatus Sulfotelmatobacter kueseliae TaxID=2042962 RepID=A0A2U3KRB8_9BACT|nr:TonB-dependent receptor [Candidatus Sulfotelmatobacter kueseliae]